MTRRRWIADEVNGNTAALVGDHAAHLARVLRAEVGQEFDIATGDEVRRGTITFISNDRVDFALDTKPFHRLRSKAAGAPKITLALAIFKFDRMEWAIEKCTEIGVAVKLKELDGALAADLLTRVVLAESEEETRLGAVLRSGPTEVVLAIGPEGGWADGELSWFCEEGWIATSLGNTILRAETAAIVATALALEALQ
jgi:16S rRNA (uracil1498-N3)-methyltransferase